MIENMFQALQFGTAMVTIANLFLVKAWFASSVVCSLFYMLLKLQGDNRFFFFDDEVRENFSKETGGHFASHDPRMKWTMGWLDWLSGRFEVSSKFGCYQTHGSRVGHVDAGQQLVADVVSKFFPIDNDPTLSVKKSGDVAKVHVFSFEASSEKVANSGDSRCPALMGAEGQSRAKQVGTFRLGVCNEHVPPPKGKMCSGLTGNRERAAEMTAPCKVVISPYIVTTRNTKYIQLWLSTLKKYQFGFSGWKEAQQTDDVAGQYFFGGNFLNIAPRLMFQIAGITG